MGGRKWKGVGGSERSENGMAEAEVRERKWKYGSGMVAAAVEEQKWKGGSGSGGAEVEGWKWK